MTQPTVTSRAAILVTFGAIAAAAGLGAGYLNWGRPTDWYATRGVHRLAKAAESDPARYGWQLTIDTPRFIGKSATDTTKRFAGNDLACTQCHMNAGVKAFAAPLISTYGSFPMHVNDQVITLEERINGCMMRSMNGKPLPVDGAEMTALKAYLRYLGKDTPEDARIAGMGLKTLPQPARPASAAAGAQVYAQTCARCHGSNGAGEPRTTGFGFSIPPLWGPDSFNAAAGMNRLETAAAFIRANMPYPTNYTEPQLTVQEAWDVAAFMTAQQRPPIPTGSVAQPR